MIRTKGEAGTGDVVEAVRHMRTIMSEIREAGHIRLELHLDGTRRAVSLLADDDLGLAMGLLHLAHPFEVFVGAFAGLASVAAVGAFGGRALLRVLPLAVIRKAGGVLLAGFAVYSLVSLVRG